MKKLITVFLLLATLLSLCACGEPQVTPTQGENVSTKAPNGATVAPTQPAEPTEPTEPPKSEDVIYVETLIAALGEVNDASEATAARIQEVLDAYNALSAQEQANVENYDILKAASEKYDSMVNKEQAATIENAIKEMGDATYKNRQAIIDVMKMYNSASEGVRAAVANAEELLTAAETVAKEMLKKMEKEEDFVRNLAFYYHSQFPRGDEYWYADQRCFSLPYLGKQGDTVWLRWICNYTDDDWVFFKKITFAVDDERYYKYFSYYEIVRDNDGGEVWEYIDMEVGATELEILQAIANSEKTIIRFEGDDYYSDFTVKSKDKEAIQFMLDVYMLLGGK